MRAITAASLATVMLLTACKAGYNRTYIAPAADSETKPECATDTANSSVDTNNTLEVFTLLAELTCNQATPQDGYIMGQSTGSGNQISTDDNERSYSNLVAKLKTDFQKSPALVAIDYEHDQIFTADELLEANDTLAQHWNDGGLVTISWTPLNPWVNNSANPSSNPGAEDDTSYTNAVNLADLINESTDVGQVWIRKLDAMAVALQDLQSNLDSDGNESPVTVLWRPLPEMNTNNYWWGLKASYQSDDTENAALFTEVWDHMFNYFTETKALNNLLWVYSPAESSSLGGSDIDWAYPGTEYVDVVAGIANHNLLEIKDYTELKNLNKPLGMAEYGPVIGGTYDGTFDNRLYKDALNDKYEFVSYWVTMHPTTIGNTITAPALIQNSSYDKLITNNDIFTLEDNIRQ